MLIRCGLCLLLACVRVQITAAEAGKTFALEWRMEATAHVASLMVRDQQCKVSISCTCSQRLLCEVSQLEQLYISGPEALISIAE